MGVLRAARYILNGCSYKPGDFEERVHSSFSYAGAFDDYRHAIMVEASMQNSQRAGEWASFKEIDPSFDPAGMLRKKIFKKINGEYRLTERTKRRLHKYESGVKETLSDLPEQLEKVVLSEKVLSTSPEA